MSEYASYMQTDVLRALQPDDPDEQLFVVVHQVSELWLVVAATAMDAAARHVRVGEIGAAEMATHRAGDAVGRLPGALLMLSRHLTPQGFAAVRPRLGSGSGTDSPGWAQLGRAGRRLDEAFRARCAAAGVSLLELCQGRAEHELARLAERMMDVDAAVRGWRMQHYLLAERLVGRGSVGTQGMPVRTLMMLADHRYFPGLWAARGAVGERVG
ncbi:tryptophan 2,3-dioxygenase family protein [Micromonospora sp. WMMA1363]|uniref:tryptophan 2,3-dioxygenase family protein n=1 Tax=Micromonospora sp. WMMA1363 TaxID=3053985 RepID=UPI00259CBEB7|nr:tryptophan 2,3-dioxygenase family protein [Micromonospora sp. WMMA1363]MDM4723311.1 tryptophan 2,3-dioxygenase family protein [Micromonospora sp. WMMA1363]